MSLFHFLLSLGFSGAVLAQCPSLQGTYLCEATDTVEETELNISQGHLEYTEEDGAQMVYQIVEKTLDGQLVSDIQTVTGGQRHEMILEGELAGYYSASCRDEKLFVSLYSGTTGPEEMQIAISKQEGQLLFEGIKDGEVFETNSCAEKSK